MNSLLSLHKRPDLCRILHDDLAQGQAICSCRWYNIFYHVEFLVKHTSTLRLVYGSNHFQRDRCRTNVYEPRPYFSLQACSKRISRSGTADLLTITEKILFARTPTCRKLTSLCERIPAPVRQSMVSASHHD